MGSLAASGPPYPKSLGTSCQFSSAGQTVMKPKAFGRQPEPQCKAPSDRAAGSSLILGQVPAHQPLTQAESEIGLPPTNPKPLYQAGTRHKSPRRRAAR